MDRIPAGIARRISPGSRAAAILRPIINRLVPSGARILTVRSGCGAGLRLMIEPASEKYYWSGAHEPHVQEALVETLRRGDNYWDVGAHIGFMALLAARAVGQSGSVVAFEPLPATLDRLKASIAATGSTNVTVEPVALTSRTGEQTLHSGPVSTMWTLAADRGGVNSAIVMCSTLDAAAEARPAPDMIKIDAEGAEVDVLRGGLRLIGERRPVLLVEFSTPGLLEEGRRLLGDRYGWRHLGANHWLLEPSGQ